VCQARIARLRRLPTALLVASAVAAGVPEAASASVASRCRSEGATVAANGFVRVYAHGSHGLELWTCAYRGRRWSPISLGQRGSVKQRRGVVDVTVAGGYVGLRVLDMGCSRGECAGPIVQVYDPLRRRQSPDVKGDSYLLRSDGTFAVVTPPDPAGNAMVELHDARGTTVAATGAIDPATLALAGRDVYWMQDGLPQTAVLQP
jgi:hypothetical protein